MLTEINNFRSSPKVYAEKIKKLHLENRKGEINTRLKTYYYDGDKAILESISLIEKLEALPILTIDKGLTVGAYNQAKFISASMKIQYKGPDGKTFAERSKLYGELSYGDEAIIISKGGNDTPQRILLELLVNDGDSYRSKRNLIISKANLLVGIGIYSPPFNPANVIVIALAESFQCTKCNEIKDISLFESGWIEYEAGCDKTNGSGTRPFETPQFVSPPDIDFLKDPSGRADHYHLELSSLYLRYAIIAILWCVLCVACYRSLFKLSSSS